MSEKKVNQILIGDELYPIDDKDNEVGKTIELTYAELVELRDNAQLVPGQTYRITDYVTTTSQEGTKSAGHQFDIIVTADTVSTLNENAKACLHEGDTYFADSNLAAWELKYSLDNNTNKFVWADSENGKGVIYYMKDEFENECSYDFKNILYSINFTDTTSGRTLNCPTFTRKSLIYYTQFGTNYSVKAMNSTKTVNGIVYYRYAISEIERPTAWSSSFFYITDEEISSSSVMYSFDEGTRTMKEISYGGILTIHKTLDTSLDGYSNKVYKNKIINDFYLFNGALVKLRLNKIIMIKDNCYNNTFGDSCYNNTFNSCYNNTFGNSCSNNKFDEFCSNNTFGNSCSNNNFGRYCSNNTFGDNCSENKFNEYSQYNIFGKNCIGNVFYNYNNSAYLSVSNLIFENNCSYINLHTVAPDKFLFDLNIKICSGVHGYSTTNRLGIAPTPNVTYQQTFTAKGSTITEVEIDEE